MDAEPSGMFVWYDPTREAVELYERREPPKDEGVLEVLEGDDQDSPGCPSSSKNELETLELPF